MKTSRIFKISVAVSIALHTMFFSSSVFVWIPGVSDFLDRTKKMFRIQSVLSYTPPQTGHSVIQKYLEMIQFQDPETATTKPTRLAREEKIKMPQIEDRSSIKKEALDSKTLLKPKEDWAREEKVDVKRRKVVTNNPIDTWENFEASGPVQKMKPEELQVPKPFEEEMFGFTPGRITVQRSRKNTISGEASAPLGKRGKGSSPYESIDEYMSLNVSTWKNEAGEGFFEILIMPGKDASRLQSMSKEIVFLIDASLSIQEQRIEEFKKGIRYVLNNLNPDDKFNIFTFKDDLSALHSESVKPDKESVNKALRFLHMLEPSEKTDLYEAVFESTSLAPAILPSYVILLSDGRPTAGVLSSKKLIEDISRNNSQRRSFFAFSGGRKVNRYLLDFLSYQNRGWSEYAISTTRIYEKISAFYDKIRYPLLRNMRYQFTQMDPKDVYPKFLPDFYQNAAFVLYGRFSEEKKFSIRLLGDINGKTKELIFAVDLNEAREGTDEISKLWAFNKIYYLISKMTLEGPNPQMREEVRTLGHKYDIETPYNIEEVFRQ